MTRYLALPLVALAVALPQQAAAQFVSDSADPLGRTCIYRDGPGPEDLRSHRVPLGEACPAYHPSPRSNLQAPPSARLVSSTLQDGGRLCSYGQRNRRWSFRVSTEIRCPLTAGLLAAMRDAPGN